MEYMTVFIIGIIILFIVKYAFGMKIKDIKTIKEIGYDKKLNEITNKLPSNKEVCEQILKDLGNTTVKIETNDDNKNSTLSYYMVLTNHIIIANINDTFTRIQTIAHECLHSIQNKRTLMFNFIFSNIYLLYFILIIGLTIFRVIQYPMITLVGLILLGIVYYVVRNYLETDAMTKAPYQAKAYIEKTGKLSKEEIGIVMENYKILNDIRNSPNKLSNYLIRSHKNHHLCYSLFYYDIILNSKKSPYDA